jgi:hypothetical protein
MQTKRQRQSANAAARDEYGHDAPLLLLASWHEGRQGATAKGDIAGVLGVDGGGARR